MQNSDIRSANTAYEAAQQDLVLGEWGNTPAALAAGEAALWGAMAAPDVEGETPIDLARQNQTNIQAITDPIAYKIAWDRQAAYLEEQLGVTRDMPEDQVRRIIRSPQGRTILPRGAYSRYNRSKYTLHQWVVGRMVSEFLRTNMDRDAGLTAAGTEVYRESLLHSAPHLTVFDPEVNTNWINDNTPEQIALREQLRDLMGEDEVPEDEAGNGQVEATPEIVSVLAYLRRIPPAALGATTNFQDIHADVVGGDVGKAETTLNEIRPLYDDFKRFRDREKRLFDTRLTREKRIMSERETLLNQHQPAADKITGIVEVEEQRFNKQIEINQIQARVDAQQIKVDDLDSRLTPTPGATPGATPATAPTVAATPRIDPRSNLVSNLEGRLAAGEDEFRVAGDQYREFMALLQININNHPRASLTTSPDDPRLLVYQELQNRATAADTSDPLNIASTQDMLNEFIALLEQNVTDHPAEATAPAPSPAPPPVGGVSPMILPDPRYARLQSAEEALEDLKKERRKAQNELATMTSKSRSLRSTYRTAHSRQIASTEPAVAARFGVVTTDPFDLDSIFPTGASTPPTPADWAAAADIADLTDGRTTIMTAHATEFTTYETDKRQMEQRHESETREFNDQYDESRSFDDYTVPPDLTPTASPTWMTPPSAIIAPPSLADLTGSDFGTFKQLEDGYKGAQEDLRKAQRERQARGNKDTKFLSPTELLRRLHETDPANIARFGDPKQRAFRSMVSSLITVNMARNRAIYSRRIRRLAEEATEPEGVIGWVRNQWQALRGTVPRSFDDYRVDHLETDSKFKNLKNLRLNSSIDQIASWIGEGDDAALTLESLKELMDNHIRPLALDAKAGSRLRIDESAKIVYLLERMEAVYCTALVRSKMKGADVPKNKAELFASMLDEQLTGDISPNSGRFMTNREAALDRNDRQETPEEGEEEEDREFSFGKLVKWASPIVTGWWSSRPPTYCTA